MSRCSAGGDAGGWGGPVVCIDEEGGGAALDQRDRRSGGYFRVANLPAAPGTEDEENFGSAVALDGDTFAVGARGDQQGWIAVERTDAVILRTAGACPGEVTLTLTGASPEGHVLLLGGREKGVLRCDGTLALSFQAGPGICSVLAQAADLASCRVSTLVVLPGE